MTDADLTIAPLIVPSSLDAADAADFVAFGALNRLVCDEETGLPDLAPTAAQMLRSWQDTSDSLHTGFVARRGDEIVGMASAAYAQEAGSRAAEFDILVPAANVGTGVDERLLHAVEDDARRRARDVLQTWTLHRAGSVDEMLVPKTGWGRIPGTALSSLLIAHGYVLEQVERNSELDLADVAVQETLRQSLDAATEIAGPDYREVPGCFRRPRSGARGTRGCSRD